MNVLVFGAGALGSVFGGFLARAGNDVVLVGRPWHLDAVAEAGLVIEGIWGTHRVSYARVARSTADLDGPFDLILVTVKSYDTATAAEAIRRLVGGGTLVVSLQNGLGNAEVLAAGVGRDRCAAGRVIFGAEITEPGRVRVTVCADDVVIGPAFPGAGRALHASIARAVAAIREAGIPCRAVEDVQPYIWAKAFYNCALNPLGALLGTDYGSLSDSPHTRVIMDHIIREAFAVARARGVGLPWSDADAYLRDFYTRMLPPTRDHRPSMLQDLERGRRTEIDALNGRIVTYGRESGIPTPYNEVITHLMRFCEVRAREKKCGRSEGI